MARVVVLPNADRLVDGIEDVEVLHVEQVEPEHLDEFHSSQQFLDRLEWAVRGGAPSVSPAS